MHSDVVLVAVVIDLAVIVVCLAAMAVLIAREDRRKPDNPNVAPEHDVALLKDELDHCRELIAELRRR